MINLNPEKDSIDQMKYNALGNSSLSVSRIGLGCVTFGREIDKRSSYAMMDYAVSHGINLFDTAAIYANGSSERIIGKWLRGNGIREKIILATKVYPPFTASNIIKSCEQSLRNLQTDSIDLFLFHTWDNQSSLPESLQAMHLLVDTGKVKHTGVSNYTCRQLGGAIEYQQNNGLTQFTAIQNNYNLAITEIVDNLVEFCHQKDIGIISYSPLGAGFLLGKYSLRTDAPAGSRFSIRPAHMEVYFNTRAFEALARLRRVSNKYNVSMITLALAWVLRRSGVACTLIGGRKPEHIKQAFAASRFEHTEILVELQ